MIARVWQGMVPMSKSSEYLRLMRTVAIPEYKSVPGNRGAFALRARARLSFETRISSQSTSRPPHSIPRSVVRAPLKACLVLTMSGWASIAFVISGVLPAAIRSILCRFGS